MSFTGKATYSAGSTLPEIAEDVADLVSIAAPTEAPLLEALGDGVRFARSTVHEWLEDSLIGNRDTVAEVVDATHWEVATISRFRTGDQLLVDGSAERVLVTAVDGATARITVTRGYGGSTQATVADGAALTILGNAALEGDDADAPRFTNRVRRSNYTQIFTATVEVSGSELAVRQLGVRDELDWMKQQRLRELLRDLENSVINGVAAGSDPHGSGTVRRTMRGIRSFLSSNVFAPGAGSFPEGDYLTEEMLNLALRQIWESAGGGVDLIACNGRDKRRINAFMAAGRRFFSVNESYKDLVSSYESDFGVCRIVVCRHVPPGTVLLLDSSRIGVLPLAGRSFHYKALASTGDAESGQLIGEYTLELRDESAHGVIQGLQS